MQANFGSSAKPSGILPYKPLQLMSRLTRLLIFTSQSDIFAWLLLAVKKLSVTAIEVELTEERDGIRPNKLQEDICNSIKDGSLFSIPIQSDPTIERSTPSITRCFNETRPVIQSRLSTYNPKE